MIYFFFLNAIILNTFKTDLYFTRLCNREVVGLLRGHGSCPIHICLVDCDKAHYHAPQRNFVVSAVGPRSVFGELISTVGWIPPGLPLISDPIWGVHDQTV